MFAQSGDAQLYWESTGSGEPVLLVMGLGIAATGWWRTVPVLAEGMRVALVARSRKEKQAEARWNFDGSFAFFLPWRSQNLKIGRQFESCSGTPWAGGPNERFCAYIM